MLPLQEWVPGVIIALEIAWSFYCSEMFMVCETGSYNSNNFTNLTVLHDIGASCNNLLHYILQYVPSNIQKEDHILLPQKTVFIISYAKTRNYNLLAYLLF